MSKNLFGISDELINDVKSVLGEKLTGGQKNLDVDKDGKIEASDFKKLRNKKLAAKMKKHEAGETAAQEKKEHSGPCSDDCDCMKEETSAAVKPKINITKSRAGHYTVTASHDGHKGKVGMLSNAQRARNSIPAAIEDLNNERVKKGYEKIKFATEEVELEEAKQYIEVIDASGQKKKVAVEAGKAFAALTHYRKQPNIKSARIVSEEAESIDEVLTKATSAADIIHDFVNSKDPKFAGKSKEMRTKMALGAYYGMHPELKKEEVDLGEGDPIVRTKSFPGEPPVGTYADMRRKGTLPKPIQAKDVKEEVEISEKVEVTIKKQTSDEPNVSKRHISYDVYHDGKYHKSFNDINDAMDHKEKMQKEETDLDENAWNQLGQQKPVGGTLPAPARGVVPKHGRKFSQGDLVVPHTGPHAGEVHKVTASRAGGVTMVNPNGHKYDTVSVRAKHEHVSPASSTQKTKYHADVKSFTDRMNALGEQAELDEGDDASKDALASKINAKNAKRKYADKALKSFRNELVRKKEERLNKEEYSIDEARGRPKKVKPGEEAADNEGDDTGSIVMKLRKASSIGKPVQFKDSSTHNISKSDARKALAKHDALRTSIEKEKLADRMHASHASFKDVLAGKGEPEEMTLMQKIKAARAARQ